uniref:heme attachment to plastid cytochrome c n=1 Tax=Massjukichlorella minus TaxID=2650457 RepID=UPI002410C2E2|nr:heme attachment to plastid cytochrome c [Massjukichlorella minus]WDY13001.1 heme attachment to plastid cytochrome c [Massjukichlorella minus]
MMLSRMQIVLMPTVFGLLFFLMILYWSQAALFSYTKYKKLTFFVFFMSILSLTGLLLLRWVESRHFPLSNLYESLLFLSWSFLFSQLLLQLTRQEYLNWDKSPTSNKNKLELENRVLATSHQSSTELQQDSAYANANMIAQTKSAVNGSMVLRTNRCKHPSFSNFPQILKNTNSGSKVKLENDQYHFIDLLGVITSPMALLTYGFAFLSLPKDMQKATALVPALQSNWLMMHVSIMILSYAALLSGSILSMAFLLLKVLPIFQPVEPDLSKAETISASSEERYDSPSIHIKDLRYAQLASQTSTSFNSLNSISSSQAEKEEFNHRNLTLYQCKSRELSLSDKLDNLSYRVLGLGFPLLTVGILSGAVWANEAWGSYWSWDPKETWALITWLVFAIYLHARITKGWSGEKPAIIATVGFFVVWFCYLGVNLLGTGLHSYGWFSN